MIQKISYRLGLISLLFLLPKQIFAQSSSNSVNLKDGSFEVRFNDSSLKNLELRYSSRMNSHSLFGLGWCSALDLQIKALRGGDLELRDCDELIRFRKVKSSSLISPKAVFFEDDFGNTIELAPQGYRLERGDERIQFNPTGQIRERKNEDMTWLRILTQTPNLWTLQVRGQILKIELNPLNQNIRRIQRGSAESWPLEFEGGYLKSLGHFSFQYDTWDNLIHFKNQNQQLHLIYDTEDRLTRVEANDTCHESFEYPDLTALQKTSKFGASLSGTARAWKVCEDVRHLTAEVTMEYSKVSEQNVVLTAAEIRDSKSKRSFLFHPILGIPQKRVTASEQFFAAKPKDSKDVVIAVIDTGADLQLPLIKKYLWTNPDETINAKDNDHNGLADDLHGWSFADRSADLNDRHGHGTHIATLIASQIESLNSGISKTRPVRMMILKYYQPDADGATNLKNSLRAFRYALEKDVDIINYSGGGRIPSAEEEDLLRQAAQQGILVIAAAGNESQDSDRNPFFPANYPYANILSIGSMGPNLRPVRSSNYGELNVDIMADGEALEAFLPGGKRGRMTGTSQATAMVTAAAASYLRQTTGRILPEQVISRLLMTSDPLPGLRSKNRMGSALSANKLIRARSSRQIAQGLEQLGRTSENESFFRVPSSLLGPKSSSYLPRTGLN